MSVIARCRTLVSKQPFTFLLSAMATLIGYRQMLLTAVILVLLTAVTTWLTAIYAQRPLVLVDHVTTILFLGLIILTSVHMISLAETVTSEAIRGAVCIYLLMGFLFALVYSLVEFLSPGSIEIGEVHNVDGQDALYGGDLFHYMIYFSFITQTTLGYGDVLPKSEEAQAIAVLQSCAGPLYLAVTIARLVAMELAAREKRER